MKAVLEWKKMDQKNWTGGTPLSTRSFNGLKYQRSLDLISLELHDFSASWEAQIETEIENPASDWENEYSRYVNRWYSLENVNIYILFIDFLFYLYPRE